MTISSENKLPLLKLSPSEVHVWFAFPDGIKDEELLKRYYSLMNYEERKRQQRFRFDHLKHDFLITRALVRTVLSRYADVTPESWQFSKNKKDKPDIIREPNVPPLKFNLSHTKSLIGCAVALDHDIGFDVENLHAKDVSLSVADRFFSDTEVKALQALPDDRKAGRFMDFWTLKESYIKARGLGLAIPLNQFSFILDKQQPVKIVFGPKIDDDPVLWKFFRLKPTPAHVAAVSVNKDGLPDMTVSFQKVVPLLSETSFACDITGLS